MEKSPHSRITPVLTWRTVKERSEPSLRAKIAIREATLGLVPFSDQGKAGPNYEMRKHLTPSGEMTLGCKSECEY